MTTRTSHSGIATALATVLLGFAAMPMALAHDASGAPAKLGKVHFKVECNAAAQKEFDLAMAYYHSFAWELYKAPLDRARQADPTCGMTYWLHALGVLDNPFTWPIPLSPKVLAEGQASLDAARKTGLKSARERDYVDALTLLYKDHDKLNHRTRAVEPGTSNLLVFDYVLTSGAGNYAPDRVARNLHEANSLPVARFVGGRRRQADSTPTESAPAQPFLRIEPDSVLVEVIKKAERGTPSEIVLRLREYVGKQQEMTSHHGIAENITEIKKHAGSYYDRGTVGEYGAGS